MMRRNQSDAVGFLLLTVCFVLYLLPLLIKVDVFSWRAVAGIMIASAFYYLLWMFLPPLVILLSKRKDRSRKMRLIGAGVALLFTSGMVFRNCPTVMPMLYSVESVNPVRDIRKAISILNDDSEPVTEICQCRVRQFRNSSVFPFLNRYALITESGAQIPVQRSLPGLYTVTYSPETGMPVSVEPYDPECGENVIAWGALIPEIMEPRFNQSCVRVKKLDRPFPNMAMRIMKNGTVIQEARYYEGDAGFFLALPPNLKGTFEAQLYSVTIGTGGDRYAPISNKAILNYR
ncbi:MAG: hypothetical protein IKH27_03525 [Oscillospiraceae bacterium]|nr:hypothetical protein [Oscillospiraceae bacterium]